MCWVPGVCLCAQATGWIEKQANTVVQKLKTNAYSIIYCAIVFGIGLFSPF